jgi:hypothetical protein
LRQRIGQHVAFLESGAHVILTQMSNVEHG